MTQPAKSKRFRVALSFPGEHRPRVEKVAMALAVRLDRDQILYDRWHAADFARPELDAYLSNLYRNESDLLVFFLCQEHATKPWTGLEWSVALDLVKHHEGHRLMYLRLDDCDIPGLREFDGYLDIRNIPEGEIAAKILTRLGMPPGPAPRTFISKLPIVNPLLIGREDQLAFLDRAWSNPITNFVQIIAAGGTGKTALVDKWFRRHIDEADVFGWSFYSQGSSPDRQTSSDPFFAELLPWLHIDIPPTASVYAKADAVAARLREERVLLILDGVEPLQDSTGALRDAALKALLQELDTDNRGLVLCTTRIRLDIPDDAPRSLSLDLDNLTPEQGAEYLRGLKVEGSGEELQKASREYGNHALALTLLGTWLADFHDHDITRRVEIRRLTAEEGKPYEHARRIIAAYERMFAGKPEAAILRALGYFDRPAEPAALKLVLPTMEHRKYQAALRRLHDARLILTTDPAQPLDCHPLVREHFAAETTREGHARLYEHYKKQAPHRPDTIEEMTPLFYAVSHGCKAGRHAECRRDVYRDRILRGGEFYLTKKLGAFGTDLSLLENFFATPWTQPAPALSPTDQSWVIGRAGHILRAIGRLADAVEPLRSVAEALAKSEIWQDAASCYGNLSQVHRTLGNVLEAVAAARQAVGCADQSGDSWQKVGKRATLADALCQSHHVTEAVSLFEEAERLLVDQYPTRPLLHGLWGHGYCDLLLSQGQTTEVLRRASQTLRWAGESRSLLEIGLDHVSLGRAHPFGSAEAAQHLENAVEFLRRAGTLDMLPLGLLARGTPLDLAEVFRIASRCGMRLYLTDYHLASARLALRNGDRAQAREHCAKAETLVQETGYHRRDLELAELRPQCT
jgi:tetratricopeptide (TPR) repeat protein